MGDLRGEGREFQRREVVNDGMEKLNTARTACDVRNA